MAERSGWSKFFLWGCGGCAGLLLLLALLGGVMAFLARGQAQDEESVSESFGERPPAVEAMPTATGSSARVVIEFERGDFNLLPGKAGEPIGVEASYDKRRYTLEQVSSVDEDGHWTYRIALLPGGTAGKPSWLANIFGARSPSLKVTLPPDIQVQLDTRISAAGGKMELGGLWLKDSRFVLNKAGIELSVSEPLKESIGRMDIDLSMAGGSFENLGNASPTELNFNIRMAGGVLDLRGEWLQDSDIVIHARRAGAEVILPRDILVEGIDSQPLVAPSVDGGQPLTLRIQSDAKADEIKFRRM